uniref:Peptidase A1 domain-containing protein n=1 Tax=Kalanchoe fedtschenkoi TaxID=63787 RepID=A0A7N0RHU4_KALFE
MSFFSWYLIILFLVLWIHVIEKCNSLSIDLIHHYSLKSPFYEPNLTHSDMIQRLLLSSRPKRIPFNNTSVDFDLKVIRPVLEPSNSGYLAKINLGTFSGQQPTYKEYHLHFDTGSRMIWLQCEDCAKPGNRCFEQSGVPYPNRRSTSYMPLPCDDHLLCFPGQCIETHCSYTVQYVEGSYSHGILAYETLKFESSHQQRGEMVRVVIGCGHENEMVQFTKEAGIFGMSWGAHSFVNQVTGRSQGRFSYCLPPLTSDGYQQASTILRFGFDTPRVTGLHRLPIREHAGEPTYYVDLQGISINGRRLNIPSAYFARTGPNKGGCIIDTGTSLTFISRPAYNILKQQMMQHLATADSSLQIGRTEGLLNLCYKRNPPFKGYNHLPTVTFHFTGGANLMLQRDIAFVVWDDNRGKENVCMVISPTDEDDVSIIGAQSQANHVFVFNLPAHVLYFGPRICAQNL